MLLYLMTFILVLYYRCILILKSTTWLTKNIFFRLRSVGRNLNWIWNKLTHILSNIICIDSCIGMKYNRRMWRNVLIIRPSFPPELTYYYLTLAGVRTELTNLMGSGLYLNISRFPNTVFPISPNSSHTLQDLYFPAIRVRLVSSCKREGADAVVFGTCLY